MLELWTEPSQIDGPRVIDQKNPMWVADIGGGALADVITGGRRGDLGALSDPTHRHAGFDSDRLGRSAHRNDAQPRVGGDAQLTIACSSTHQFGLREAPDAVAADLCARPVRVVEGHP